MSKLTRKQELFCQEYLVDLNAKYAAIRAGYSEKAATEIGYENLQKANVSERIALLFSKRIEKIEITADYVLDRLVEMDNLDIIDIVNDEMDSFKPISQWPKAWRRSISGVDISKMVSSDNIESVVKKIKWPDKVKNLELIGKHINVNAFTKTVELNATVTSNIMPVPTAASVEDWENSSAVVHDKNLKNE